MARPLPCSCSAIGRGSSHHSSGGMRTGRRHHSAAGRPPPATLAWRSASAAAPCLRRRAECEAGGNDAKAAESEAEAEQQQQEDDAMWWRMYGIEIDVSDDPGKDSFDANEAVLAAICQRLRIKRIDAQAVGVYRKSFDARMRVRNFAYKERLPKGSAGDDRDGDRNRGSASKRSAAFVYVVDLCRAKVGASRRWKASRGRFEPVSPVAAAASAAELHPLDRDRDRQSTFADNAALPEHVVVVGAGPAGLFAALTIAEESRGRPVRITLIERGQPVERRGRDIGALFARRVLNPESNLCFGEGGAGTWSDGKLTTRIGRNSREVRKVLDTLVQFGASGSILTTGSPHLGTDKLVRILRAFRSHLQHKGVEIRFGTKLVGLEVDRARSRLEGVQVQPAGASQVAQERLRCSSVVLAIGHSARDTFSALREAGVAMTTKAFAMGFRIEHPQHLIDQTRLGSDLAAMVQRGKGKIPVSSYRLTYNARTTRGGGDGSSSSGGSSAPGRSVYSFCMCPGGQVVPTTTNREELCVNGMSFSRRNSPFANSAVVATVGERDWEEYAQADGPMAGVMLQREIERKASALSGDGLRAPSQRLVDFMLQRPSASLPAHSYRLGVLPGRLDQVYSAQVTEALRSAAQAFEKDLPGFLSEDALLVGVETRTSCPLQMSRRAGTLESISLEGLFPAGEGAGYAGGIVSAAVDGIHVGRAVLARLAGTEMERIPSQAPEIPFY